MISDKAGLLNILEGLQKPRSSWPTLYISYVQLRPQNGRLFSRLFCFETITLHKVQKMKNHSFHRRSVTRVTSSLHASIETAHMGLVDGCYVESKPQQRCYLEFIFVEVLRMGIWQKKIFKFQNPGLPRTE